MSLYEPLDPSRISHTEAQRYLSLNMNNVRRFIYEYNIHATVEDFARMLNGDLRLGYEVIYDYTTPAEQKKQWIHDWLTEGSKILMLTGKRGSGKTATAYLLLEWCYYAGIKPYILGPPQDHAPEIRRITRLQDQPENSMIFIDEIGIRYNARDSGKKDRVVELNILPIFRHAKRSAIVGTQLSSLGDLNFSRLTDGIITKPMGLFGNSLERDTLRQAVPDVFMPKDMFESHFMCSDFRCNVDLGLSSWWRPEYSTPYRLLEPEEVMDYLRELVGDEMSDDDILKEVKLRSTDLSDSEIKDLVKDIQKGL
jgi:hypothetical protein